MSTEGGKLLRRTLGRLNGSMVELINDRETIINGEDWRCRKDLGDWAATTEKHTGSKEEKVCKVSPTEPVFKEPAQKLSPRTVWLWGKVKWHWVSTNKNCNFYLRQAFMKGISKLTRD